MCYNLRVTMKGENSKYRPICETLRREVMDGKYGNGHPFPSEVAPEFAVSAGTATLTLAPRQIAILEQPAR